MDNKDEKKRKRDLLQRRIDFLGKLRNLVDEYDVFIDAYPVTPQSPHFIISLMTDCHDRSNNCRNTILLQEAKISTSCKIDMEIVRHEYELKEVE